MTSTERNIPRALNFHEAEGILDRAGRGAEEFLGALGDEPVVLVDLDSARISDLRVPPLLPAVVIGFSSDPDATTDAAAGLDLLVTSRRGAGKPWVQAGDLEAEIAELTLAITTNPIASTTLAQVLRVGEGTPTTTGLAIESLAYSTLQGGSEFASWDAARPTPIIRPDEPDPVLVEREGDVMSVILNRPSVHNAYNAAMRDALCDALSVAAADPSVIEVRLIGAGRSFCSGGDLKEFGSREDPAIAQLIRTGRSPARLIAILSDRVTAFLHGFCVGSGMELPAFAARVLAEPGATFRLPEIAMGLIPGAGGTVSLPARIGRHRTAWLALAGRPIDTPTAHDWGLVDAVVSPTATDRGGPS